MTTSTEITTVLDTTLERAFKTPMLCDVREIHTGYGVTPRVTHCTDDATWGRVGGSRQIIDLVRLDPKRRSSASYQGICW